MLHAHDGLKSAKMYLQVTPAERFQDNRWLNIKNTNIQIQFEYWQMAILLRTGIIDPGFQLSELTIPRMYIVRVHRCFFCGEFMQRIAV